MIPTGFAVLVPTGSAYTPPVMNRTGSTGNIAPVAAGYLLSAFSDATYAYLAAGKTTGKWYWEATAANYILFGITDTPTTARTFGGYASTNAGFYIFNATIWNQYGTGSWSGTAPVPGNVLGFALDMTGKTLKIYCNNVLGSTLALTTIGATAYPLFAFQASPTASVYLGAGHTTYAPPAGYSYL